ncbi:trigger factor [Sulfurimonas gotlandica GD1]|jgi:trigger factor|uniref:Trigger factor n=1 Tax=Sulfurimonas gotlandica (strain DSM 19862 / JCM 16533 / GD1) TaxID=929558 RepID=B6BGT7_SULGG|nr:trigger factor [Sulfurimonas gotlandica]EDZ63723.1 trigger factor [Sulfurimonas gotlandica GD1]EHP29719.1 trigger factor [Sulfurimonas gotlandica GD1]
MEIKSNKIDGANATIEATILREVIDVNLEKIAKELAKTASIQGFRKGKVPVAIVKKQYGERLVQDAEAEALRDVLARGLEELNISNDALIGEPNISKFDKSDDKIEVVVKVAMRPVIELGDYSSMIKEFDKPAVSDEAVEKRIKDLAEAQAPLIEVARNRKMKDGDTAVIDFEGSVDGKVFEGGTAENFELRLGSGQFIPGFEDQLIGVKRDEAVVIEVTFPENYGGKELAGKAASFKVKVNGIKVKDEVAIDDELAKKMLPGDENATLAELQKQVRIQIENEELAKLYNDDLKPALLENFVENIKFDLPEFVVDQEIDMALNRKAQSMSEEEIQELRDSEEKLNELRDTFREDAQRSVRATFIIDALANAENVKVEEQEVMQTIYYEAMQMGQDPQKAYEQYKNAGYIPAVQMSMVEDKVLSQLLNSKIKEA